MRAQDPIFRLQHLHGTAALVHEDAYHMAVRWQTMSPTAVDQHGRQQWAAIHGPCFQLDLQPDAFTHEGRGGRFF